MRYGSIAESYLDPLAVRIESIRMGKARGWKRFLVFAELTKSRKGVEYIALFVYFSFEGETPPPCVLYISSIMLTSFVAWMRTVFADGPRQVVNAITLYSVMRLNLIPEGEHASHDGTSPFVQFFYNVKVLADQNQQQSVILFGMLFTLIIWVISVLSLALAVVFYLLFLWHYIPSEDGSLKAYCRRKINTRLKEIVRRKVTKALNKGVALQERKPTQPTPGAMDRKPTLPILPSVGDTDGDKLPRVNVSRTTTQTTLPSYSRSGSVAPDRNPGLRRQPTLPDVALSDDQLPLKRTATEASAYSESASLSEDAAAIGYSPIDHHQPYPAPPVPPLPNDVVTRFHTPISRPSTAQTRYTPGPPASVDGSGRRTPAAGYQRFGDGYESEAYPPTSGYRPGPDINQPYQPFSPAVEPYSRSLAPGGTGSPQNDGYPVRSFTPSNRGPSPRAEANGPMNDYPPRSLTPGAQGGGSQPSGYVPFNPSTAPRAQPPNPFAYRPDIRPGTVPPSNGYNNRGPPPIRAYSPRINTPQPPPGRQGEFY